MLIQNIRLGFATNSSSSHSIVFNPDYVGRSNHYDEGMSSDCEFGWDFFTLNTVSEKLSYLAIIVRDALRYEDFTDTMVRALLLSYFEGHGIQYVIDKVMDGYIDHQSMGEIHHNSLEDFEKQIKEYIEIFSDPRIVIYGGNDNVDYDEAPYSHRNADGQELNLTMRLKKDGQAIVMFNPVSGAKIRLSTDSYVKSIAPELVDIKITDFCPYGCSFCYQDSTKEGKHANLMFVTSVLKALGEMNTFEVAIGGGEPTEYPYFASILNTAYESGIIPNFTTFAVNWMLDEVIVKAVDKCVGGIGVSVHSLSDLKKLDKITKKFPNKQVLAQHVFGTMPAEDTRRFLDTCHYEKTPVLLLGYKETGRGMTMKPDDMLDYDVRWLGNMPQLSVDTAFVQKHKKILDKLKVHPKLVTGKEGAFSCYIDAVAQKIGPSSYCEQSEMVSFPDNHWSNSMSHLIQDMFAKF